VMLGRIKEPQCHIHSAAMPPHTGLVGGGGGGPTSSRLALPLRALLLAAWCLSGVSGSGAGWFWKGPGDESSTSTSTTSATTPQPTTTTTISTAMPAFSVLATMSMLATVVAAPAPAVESGVVYLNVFNDSHCSRPYEPDAPLKFEPLKFEQDPGNAACWLHGETDDDVWSYTAVCKDGIISVNVYEGKTCTTMPYVFASGVHADEAIGFFQGLGCQVLPHPESEAEGYQNKYGKLSYAMPVGSYPACVGEATTTTTLRVKAESTLTSRAVGASSLARLAVVSSAVVLTLSIFGVGRGP